MFDLKVINSVLAQLEEERGIPREKIFEAIELALGTAYKKEYGKKGQIIKADFDINTGSSEFSQVKIVVDKDNVIMPEERDETDEEAAEAPEPKEIVEGGEDGEKVHFNAEHHILLEDAQRIKKDAQLEEEMIFPLELKSDFGRIAAQTAKQVVIQKIREAEKVSVLGEYGEREGEIVNGTVQRVERGNVFVDMGRATGIIPYEEQIPGERFRPGERIRGYLYKVEESPRGVFIKISRSHPKFLMKLFEQEAPEINAGTVVIKAVAREAGSRSKIAVISNDDHIDPVGSLVGQRGVRVATVMSELGGEKIDIIEWSDDEKLFIEDSLSPAKVLSVELTDKENKETAVTVENDQQSLAIGKGGQNVRLAAKLTGWKIDIRSDGVEEEEVEVVEDSPKAEDAAPADETTETPETEETVSEEVTNETTDGSDGTAEETEEKPAEEEKEEKA
jgi:transcription termination/antitermination protein NusA